MEPPDSPVWAAAEPEVPGEAAEPDVPREASPRGDRAAVLEDSSETQNERVDLYVSNCQLDLWHGTAAAQYIPQLLLSERRLSCVSPPILSYTL